MTATYIALATITLTSTDSEIVFSSIPATYRDLIIVATGTGTGNTGSSLITFNNDNGANYSEVAMYGLGSGSGGSYSAAGINYNQGMFFRTTRGNYTMQLFDYAQTNKHKTLLSRMDVADYATFAMAGRYASTNAIHTIKLQNANSVSFAIGSTISLYGIN